MIKWLLVIEAVMHGLLAAEFNAFGEGRLTMIFIATAVPDVCMAGLVNE